MSGNLLVLTGFPASGKDTIANLFVQKRPEYKMIITYSSRPPREGEIEGIHHHFVTNEEFENKISQGFFFEYVKSGSFYKGTSKDSFKEVLEGKSILWRNDPYRMAFLEETFYEKFDKATAEQLTQRSVKIFLRSYHHKTLRDRYLARQSKLEDIKEFEKRFNEELKIFHSHRPKFPNVIVNKKDNTERTIEEIEKILDFRKG